MVVADMKTAAQSNDILKAQRLAYDAHEGQTYGDSPFIIHPKDVVLRSYRAAYGPVAIAAAWLHDVVEDTDVTLDDLRERGFDERVVTAVDALTRRDGEQYFDYIRRAMQHPVGHLVKIADNRSNWAELWRYDDDERRLFHANRYNKAWKILTGQQS